MFKNNVIQTKNSESKDFKQKMTSHLRSATPPPPQGGSLQLPPQPPSNSSRSKSLMESLLVAKMEQVALGGPQGRPLIRTDSTDSASSIGSLTSVTSDVCRCDDCLLGIADLYAQETEEPKVKKKVNFSSVSNKKGFNCLTIPKHAYTAVIVNCLFELVNSKFSSCYSWITICYY